MPKVKKEKKEKKNKRSKKGVNIKSNYQKVIVKVNNGTSKKSDGNPGYNVPSSGHHTTLYVPTQNPILENRYEPIPKHTLEDILKELKTLKIKNKDENMIIDNITDRIETPISNPIFSENEEQERIEKSRTQYDIPDNPLSPINIDSPIDTDIYKDDDGYLFTFTDGGQYLINPFTGNEMRGMRNKDGTINKNNLIKYKSKIRKDAEKYENMARVKQLKLQREYSK